MAINTRMNAGVIGPWCWPGLRFFALYSSTLRMMAFFALWPMGVPGTRRKTFSRAGEGWKTGMVSPLRLRSNRQGEAEFWREFTRCKNPLANFWDSGDSDRKSVV